MSSALYISSGHRFVFVMFVLIGSYHALAQSARPAFFHYTTDDGLPSSECYEIIQDKEGYIWISGDNGVSRFDGHEFKNYGTEEGLLNKTVLIMQEDHRGWIWMSTFSGNFYIFRGDTIVSYPHNHLIQELRNEFYAVKNFKVDTAGNLHANFAPYNIIKITPDGQLSWPGLNLGITNGIYHVDGYKMLYNSPLKNNALTGESNKFFHLFNESRIIDKFFHSNSNSTATNDLLKSNRYAGHQIWKIDDLYLLQLLNRLYYWKDNRLLDHSYFPGFPINQLVKTRSGVLYVSDHSRKGVHVYKDLLALKTNQSESHYLPNFTISHILEDRDGGIWHATTENGIFYSPAPKVMTLLTQEVIQTNTFIKHLTVVNDTTAIAFNQQQEYLQISNRGKKSHWQSFSYPDILNFSYYHKKSDLLLVGPILFYSSNDFSNWQQVLKPKKKGRVFCKSISLPSRSPDAIWFSEYKNSLAVIGKLSIENQQITQTEEFLLPDRGRIHAIAEMDGRLALGDRQQVYFFDPQTRDITEIPILDTIKSRIDDLYYTTNKQLLIATRGQGLGVFNPITNALRLLSTDDLLVSNSVGNILEDKHGHIWLSSQNGVNKIALGDSVNVQSYTIAEGLPSNDVLDLDEWGDFIAVTTGKGIALLPLGEQVAPQLPTPFTHQIYLNNQLLDFAEHSVFSYQENSLRFVFYYLNYRHQGKFNYRYRLHPKDDWTITDNREIILSSLPPDDYKLEVEISALGLPFGQRQEFYFTITPPFWQQTGVIITAGFIVLLVTFALINGYIKRLRQESEKIKLDEDINKLRQQAYRAQMNPHFIFNCLSTIQGMIIGDATEQDAAVRMVARFSQLIRLALDASNEETVTLEEELKLLNNYIGLEQIRFNQKFSYEIKVDPKLERDWVQIPPMLVQPFVENAVLHGMEYKDGDGEIIVDYRLIGDHLCVKISDNGPGIYHTKALKALQPSKYQHKSLGMTITQQRLAILNDANYEVSIEEPRDKSGRISGTEVTLQIPIN